MNICIAGLNRRAGYATDCTSTKPNLCICMYIILYPRKHNYSGTLPYGRLVNTLLKLLIWGVIGKRVDRLPLYRFPLLTSNMKKLSQDRKACMDCLEGQCDRDTDVNKPASRISVISAIKF